MRAFPIPIQINDEEKIFGGHLSLRQMAYVFVLGPGIGGFVAFNLPFSMGVKACIFLIIWSISLVFSFVRVYDMNIDSFAWLAIKWYRSQRIYTWEGKG